MQFPQIETERLQLGPFRVEDAPRVGELVGVRAVAETTRRIPHPYPEGAARAFILAHIEPFAHSSEIAFAVRLRGSLQSAATGEVVGGVGLDVDDDRTEAELGYWIGRAYWGRGYATEAAGAAVAWGFDSLQLAAIRADCLADNPASARVLEKLGMLRVGTRRKPFRAPDDVRELIAWRIERPAGA